MLPAAIALSHAWCAIAMIVSCGLMWIDVGKTLASQTNRLRVPCTRKSVPTTPTRRVVAHRVAALRMRGVQQEIALVAAIARVDLPPRSRTPRGAPARRSGSRGSSRRTPRARPRRGRCAWRARCRASSSPGRARSSSSRPGRTCRGTSRSASRGRRRAVPTTTPARTRWS